MESGYELRMTCHNFFKAYVLMGGCPRFMLLSFLSCEILKDQAKADDEFNMNFDEIER